MDNPLISIIIPVYNTERYLSQCLDSVIGQTYDNLEIICVNDGSMDDSLRVLEQYVQQDSRIKLISQANSGASVARNKALNIALGEYIMFVDSDDWIELDTCEKAIVAIEKYDADVVMWDYIREFSDMSKPKSIFRENVIFENEELKKIHRRFIGIVGEELKKPENADALSTIWCKLYKRKYIYSNNIRFYDIRKIGTYEDGLFNLDVFGKIDRAVYINEYLYHYRKDNESSVTRKYKFDLQAKHENLHQYMQEYIISHNLGGSYKIALNNRIAFELVAYGLNILQLSNRRLRAIKDVITNIYYKQAYYKLEYKYMPIHWKLFYGCAKRGCAVGVFVLLWCINKIIRR